MPVVYSTARVLLAGFRQAIVNRNDANRRQRLHSTFDLPTFNGLPEQEAPCGGSRTGSGCRPQHLPIESASLILSGFRRFPSRKIGVALPGCLYTPFIVHMATYCSSVTLRGRPLSYAANDSQVCSKRQISRTRRQLSTRWSFTPAALPYVDFGWTFNPADACSVGGQYCNIKENSSTLSANKRNIGAAADRVLADEPDSGKRESYKALMLAVAMQESRFMDQRDASKDPDPLSLNCSVLNINCDLLKQAGKLSYASGSNRQQPPIDQNVDCYALRNQNLDRVLQLLRRAFDVWGPKRTLDFIRGGGSGFIDGIGGSCNCPVYRRAIDSLYHAFSADPALMTDGRRGQIDVPSC